MKLIFKSLKSSKEYDFSVKYGGASFESTHGSLHETVNSKIALALLD